jgi:hypothetical protein
MSYRLNPAKGAQIASLSLLIGATWSPHTAQNESQLGRSRYVQETRTLLTHIQEQRPPNSFYKRAVQEYERARRSPFTCHRLSQFLDAALVLPDANETAKALTYEVFSGGSWQDAMQANKLWNRFQTQMKQGNLNFMETVHKIEAHHSRSLR